VTDETTELGGEREVVYLDVDDEITSAAARLRGTGAERVVFVLPYGSRLATSRINFRLLAREAGSRGKQLEIVAGDASARALAGSAGLTVHASLAGLDGGEASADVVAEHPGGTVPPPADLTETRLLAVPRAADRVPMVGPRRPIVQTRTALIAGAVLVVVLAVGGLGAFLYLPSATIVLTPTSEAVGPLALTIEARPDVLAPDAASLTVPAKTFSFNLAATQTFTTTGTKVTETKATGSVTFSNFDTGGSNRIRAGSIVATESGIEFLTVSDVTLPPAGFDFFPPFSVHPSTTSVAVEAVLPGPAGNVGAETVTVIPKGENKNLTKVTNPDPMTGGTHTETPEVSQQDVDAAMAALTTQLRGDLDTQVREATGVPAGTTLFEATKTLGTPTPSVDPATLVGQEVAMFDLGLTATGTVLGVDPTPVTAIAEQRLTEQVGDGWQLQSGSTHVDVGAPSLDGSVVTFPVSVTGTRARVVDHDALLRQILGLDLAQARARLAAYGRVEVTLWPDWVTTIPTNGRVSLTIGTPAPAGTPSP
jgi:hypothetical protein